ncbi:MAG: aldC [Rhodospirillales bacterium]|jgi:hypothetical protein|nr:aldC [Rhodospirillales bacterium]
MGHPLASIGRRQPEDGRSLAMQRTAERVRPKMMDEVTMHTAAQEQPVEGGPRIEVTWAGPTFAAIRRMVPAHAHELSSFPGWQADAEPTSDGVVLTETSIDPRQTARVRGLSFIGLMASGSHHQEHHLAMAKGEFQH